MFKYNTKNNLYIEGVAAQDLVQEFGSPLYVYSAQIIRQNVQNLQTELLALKPHFHYSVKANSNLSLLRLLKAEGLGFDIVSGGELARLEAIEADLTEVSFAGVGKTVAELTQALQAGVGYFNVESGAELARLAQIATSLKKPAQVLLRLNPDVDAHTHHYITTGKAINKFGMDFETAGHLCNQHLGHPWLKVVGFHLHIGSQITDFQPYIEAAEKTFGLY